jgi:hypothetical protein
MAKNPIPKKVAGMKIPRSVRRSKTLRSLLSNKMGREIVASAITAGAGAAAAALVRRRDDLGLKGEKRSPLGVVREAIGDGADAIMGVVADAARAVGPDRGTVRGTGRGRPADDPRH